MKFVFPIILIVLDIGAAIFYAVSGDWRHAVYWLAGAIGISAITF